MQKKFEVRVTKMKATISMHVEEKNVLNEEIVVWKKRHLDSEETCRDLQIEIKRLRRQLEEYKELQEMDADEDAIREHKLRKCQAHLKELEDKYHHLKKDYDALLHMQEKFIHIEQECHMWKEKYAHMEKECQMWEEKFHAMEAKYHEVYSKIAIHMRTIDELKISIAGHDAIIAEWEVKCRGLEDMCAHLRKEVSVWEKKCFEWEEKHGHLLIKISEFERSIQGHDVIIIEW